MELSLTEDLEPTLRDFLLGLERYELIDLVDTNAQARRIITDIEFVHQLAKIHELPTVDDFQELIAFSHMNPDELLVHYINSGRHELAQEFFTNTDPEWNWSWKWILTKVSPIGNKKIFMDLFSKSRIEDISTYLTYASSGGHAELTKTLLDRGAKIGVADLWCASKSGNYETVKLLLDYGEPVNYCALKAAAGRGYIDIVQLLLERDVNSVFNNILIRNCASEAKYRSKDNVYQFLRSILEHFERDKHGPKQIDTMKKEGILAYTIINTMLAPVREK